MTFLEDLYARAHKNPKRIVFAEGTEARVQEASKKIQELGIAIPILVEEPTKHAHFEEYVSTFQSLRSTTREEATAKLSNPHYFATMMLHSGEADAMIAGPTAPSRERILPALEIIKTDSKFHKASSVMVMLLPQTVDPDAANGGVLFFADCALNVSPSVEELAHIAIDTAHTASNLGVHPIVALLSFSTAGSSTHPLAHRMKEAADLVRAWAPELAVEGEMQVDAALIDSIGASKDPGSSIAGHANVLIFPDLEAGNIAYKLVERLAGAQAIGPILQGLQKPVNELSRGASMEDIVNLAAISTINAQHTT